MMRHRFLGAVGFVVAWSFAACGGSGDSDGGDSDGGDGDGDNADGGVTGGDGDGSGASPPDGSGGASNGDGDGDGDTAGDGDGDGDGDQGGSPGAGGQAGSGGAGEPTTGGCTLVWESGYENGFPGGEWLNYEDGTYSPDGEVNPGKVSAWTIIDRASGEPVYSGDHAYKGWVVGSASENHRPYPVIHTDIQTPLVNTFMVYLDLDYDQLGSDWVHFGTWGNEEGDTGSWALHTMSVRNRELEYAHTTPSSGEYIGPNPEPEFPLGKWVRFTVYILYEGNTGYVQAWQDGVPMLRGEVSDLAQDPGTRLTRAHWGLYAPGTMTAGTQYSDDVAIWTLDEPLTDLEAEPDCYLGN